MHFCHHGSEYPQKGTNVVVEDEELLEEEEEEEDDDDVVCNFFLKPKSPNLVVS